MRLAVGALFVLLVFLGSLYLVFWLSVALIPFDSYRRFAPIVALVSAALVARSVWITLRSDDTSVLRTTLVWAAVVGAIGFAAGFFGPIIFAPEANQGPLLGIFYTGPGGFLVGAIAGWIQAHRKRSRSRRAGSDSNEQPDR